MLKKILLIFSICMVFNHLTVIIFSILIMLFKFLGLNVLNYSYQGKKLLADNY